MATLAGLTTDTLNMLYGMSQAERPQEDTITADLAQAATTMSVATTNLWKRGDYAEFSDGEVVICAADASAGSVTIRRKQRGSSDVAHTSGDAMIKNPLFPIVEVQQQITDVVARELWPHVWTWTKGTVTWAAGDHMYDLPANVDEVDLVYQVDADTKVWKPFPTEWWDTERQIATLVSANNIVLRLRQTYDSTATIYYTGRLRPTSDTAGLAAMSDDVASLIPWAAKAKIVAGRPSATQYDPAGNVRRDGGGTTRQYRLLRAEFEYQRDQLRRRLLLEVRRVPRFRSRQRRRW